MSGTLQAAAFQVNGVFVSPDPPWHDFGAVTVGKYKKFTFPFTNHGDTTSAKMSFQVYSQINGEFLLTANQCKGRKLSPGESCNVTVKFAPNSMGNKFATLQVTIPGGGSATLTGVGQ